MDVKDKAGVFRTVNDKPIRWVDKSGVIHAAEGADVHRGVRLLWTPCGRDIPADTAVTSYEPITCPHCIAKVA